MMKVALYFAGVCRKYKFTSILGKTTKANLCSSTNRAQFHCINQCSVFTVWASTFYASFHSSATLYAKQFQDRENEYAHSVMCRISSYNNSTVKHPLTLKNGPLDSSSPEISLVQELLDFSKEKEGESHAKHLIFVYGTLKRNEPNHDLVSDSSKGKAIFDGMGRTVQKFPLVIASRYNIPYLLYKEGVGKHVVGELYKVDNDMLERMDELECNGKYYTRIKIEVQPFLTEEDSVLPVVEPWVYFLMNYREHLLDLPHLENYSSKGPHGLEYVSSEDTSDPEQIYE